MAYIMRECVVFLLLLCFIGHTMNGVKTVRMDVLSALGCAVYKIVTLGWVGTGSARLMYELCMQNTFTIIIALKFHRKHQTNVFIINKRHLLRGTIVNRTKYC